MTLHFNDEEKQAHRVDELLTQEAEEYAQSTASATGLQYVDLSRISINTDALRLIPEETAKKVMAACYHITGREVRIAVVAPQNEGLRNVLDELSKTYTITLYVASKASLERAWERYKEVSYAEETKSGQVDISDAELASFMEKIKEITDIQKLVDDSANAENTVVTQIIEIILAGALVTKASDVHIEPQEEGVRTRLRIDGILTDVGRFNHKVYHQVLSRLKLISALKLNVGSMRQDGRFSIKIGANSIEVRTSIIPGGYGESVVMRILNPESINVTLDQLGMDAHLYGIMEKEIDKPNGMILNTGPTGSGKTTTLYAFLRKVNDPGSKIITIEDPIEYHMTGITQTQVEAEKGYTFNEGLKSAMRQDPDIIMVGEIRDGETAATAIDAALTGHLVFSTLHTNNAAGAIPRLIDLGVNPKVIGPALSVALAQRLVRKVCKDCKEEVAATEKELAIINPKIEEIKARGIAVPEKITLTRGKGCNTCHSTGYKGRLGIFEAILVDEEVERVIVQNPSEYDIAKAAEPQKILTLAQDGIMKIITGVTTIEEVVRVVDLD